MTDITYERCPYNISYFFPFLFFKCFIFKFFFPPKSKYNKDSYKVVTLLYITENKSDYVYLK